MSTGNYQSVFARVEKKYLLRAAQCESVIGALREHGFEELNFGSPLIQSIYYDTADHLLARRSVERPEYKEKLRLRTYGRPTPASPAYVEIKKKVDHVVYKRRVGLPLPVAMADIAAGSLPDSAGQIGREISWLLRFYGGLSPAALIACERSAWEKPSEGLRVTFDRNIRFRCAVFDPTRPASGSALLPDDTILMEVKVPGAYPLWLTGLLWNTGARQTHFSKYGAVYTEHIVPAQRRQREELSIA